MSFSWRWLKQEIKTISSEYDNVFLMVSGGVDSMFMLDLVARTIANPHVIHFQHHIRADDDIDRDLVIDAANSRKLQVHIGNGRDLVGIANQEHVAREQRWNFVQDVISSYQGRSIVLTAHHYDDNLEHYFMASMRGSNVSKLVMKKLNINSDIFHKYKPLLDLDKQTIVQSARSRGVIWREDVTNNELVHERNILRNKIIPDMMKIRNIRKSMRNLITSLT